MTRWEAKTLDSRLRGNDEQKRILESLAGLAR